MRAAPNPRSRKKSFAGSTPAGRPRKGSSGRTESARPTFRRATRVSRWRPASRRASFARSARRPRSSLFGTAWGSRRARFALDAARELAAEIGSPLAEGLTEVCEAAAAYLSGHFPEGHRHSVRAEEILRTRCTGVAWELTNVHIFGSWSLAHMGEIDALHQTMPDLLQRARERGDLLAYCTLLGGIPNVIRLLAEDSVDAARAAVEEAGPRWPTEDFQLPNLFRARFRDAHRSLRRPPARGARAPRGPMADDSGRRAPRVPPGSHRGAPAARPLRGGGAHRERLCGGDTTRRAKRGAADSPRGDALGGPARLGARREHARPGEERRGDVRRAFAGRRRIRRRRDASLGGRRSSPSRRCGRDRRLTAAGVRNPERFAEALIPIQALKGARAAAPRP